MNHVLGWSSLSSAAGVGEKILATSQLVIAATFALVGIVVVVGLYLYSNAKFDQKRVEADFAKFEKPIVKQMLMLEKQQGLRKNVRFT